MIYPYNVHTHTVFCDGKNTPEEMAAAAAAKGIKCLGFSGHSPIPVENDWCMSEEGERAYCAEITSLKDRLSGTIDVLLGVELDYDSIPRRSNYDYIIGSVHHIVADGVFHAVDGTREMAIECIEKVFRGDIKAYVAEYYKKAANVVDKTGADIVGHFDVLTVHNEDGSMFDENSGWYKKCALDALEIAAAKKRPFEINTKPVYNGYRSAPYPAKFILCALRELGAEIVLNGDCHDCASIGFYQDEAIALAKSCGFDHLSALTKNGWIKVEI